MNKTVILTLRGEHDEKELLTARAHKNHMSLNSYVRFRLGLPIPKAESDAWAKYVKTSAQFDRTDLYGDTLDKL